MDIKSFNRGVYLTFVDTFYVNYMISIGSVSLIRYYEVLRNLIIIC